MFITLYGIFSYDIALPRVELKYGHRAFGDYILNLEIVELLGFFDDMGVDSGVFAQPVLNDFIAFGKTRHQAVN